MFKLRIMINRFGRKYLNICLFILLFILFFISIKREPNNTIIKTIISLQDYPIR